MTGKMLEHIEQILIEKRPDIVMVYGDTNSTLAAIRVDLASEISQRTQVRDGFIDVPVVIGSARKEVEQMADINVCRTRTHGIGGLKKASSLLMQIYVLNVRVFLNYLSGGIH